MSILINKLSEKILQSSAFQNRYKILQRFAGSTRLESQSIAYDDSLTEKLLLQASVLALSDEIAHKRMAQKIAALFYETKYEDIAVNYAIQVIASRLGNYPAISEASNVFGESNLIKMLQQNNTSERVYDFDAEIIGNIFIEEEKSRLKIKENIYHFNIFQKEILDALRTKIVVSFSAPTSFGKSFIVRHHIARQYAEDQIARALIIVPTKSLIDDFFEDIARIKRELNLDYSIFTHARSVQVVPDKCIFILTQERLSFLINKSPDLLRTIQLVYCDEAHYISRGYRGFVLRDVLQKVIGLCGVAGRDGTAKYIFSSPIIRNPQYYKERFFPSLDDNLAFHKEIKYSPVEKNIHLVANQNETVRYYLLRDATTLESFEEKLDEISVINIPASLRSNGHATTKIRRDIYAVINSHSSGGSILYTTSPLMAHKYAVVLAGQLSDKELIDQREIEDLAKYIREHYDESFRLIEFIKKGVGLHYGPMPVGLRRVVVNLFERGYLDYLVCTSTLLEGVNLPAKNIFIFSDKYGGYGGKEKYSPLSFWNLIGRAGRITYGLSGNVFCIEEQPQKYKNLIENPESEIKDPEIEVPANKTREQYIIKTFVSSENRYDYVSAQGRSDIEYLIYELLTREHPEHFLRGFNIDEQQRADLLSAIREQKRSLTIPTSLTQSIMGIDPRLQNELFVSLMNCQINELTEYFDLAANSMSLTGEQLSGILSVTSNTLKWPKNSGVARIANRLTQWLHEMSISAFIQQSLRHIEQGNDDEHYFLRVSKAIEIIRGLETELSFNAPKYLKCFFDIALFVAQTKNIPNIDIHREKVEALLFSLESGISSFIGKFLFEKGVSRPVAIRANSLIQDLASIPITTEFFRQREIVDRLRVGLSKIAFEELMEHVKE